MEGRQIKVLILKPNDQNRKNYTITVPATYSVNDLKHSLHRNCGLIVTYINLFKGQRVLSDNEIMSSLLDHANMDKLTLTLDYAYDSEEELIKEAQAFSSKKRDECDRSGVNFNRNNENNNFGNGVRDNNNEQGRCNNYRDERRNYNNNDRFIQNKRNRQNAYYNESYHTGTNPWGKKKNNFYKNSNNDYDNDNNNNQYEYIKRQNQNVKEEDNVVTKSFMENFKDDFDFDKEVFVMPEVKIRQVSKIGRNRNNNYNNYNNYNNNSDDPLVQKSNAFKKIIRDFSSGLLDCEPPWRVIDNRPSGSKDESVKKEENYDFIDECENIEDIVAKLYNIKVDEQGLNQNEAEMQVEENDEFDKKNEEMEIEDEDENEAEVIDINSEDINNIRIKSESEYIQEELKEKEFESIINTSRNLTEKINTNSIQQNFTHTDIINPQEEVFLIPDNFNNNINTSNTVNNITFIEPPETNQMNPTPSLPSLSLNPSFYREELISNFKELSDLIKSKKISKENLHQRSQEFNKMIDQINIDKSFIQMNEKLNVILDIDSTILFCAAKEEQEYHFTKEEQEDQNIYQFEMNCPFTNTKYFMKVNFRKGLKDFLLRVSKFSTLHINTHGFLNYGLTIAEEIYNRWGIEIPRDRVIGRNVLKLNQQQQFKNITQFPHLDKKKTLVLDDNAKVWENDHANVITSMKYYSFIPRRIVNLSSLTRKLGFPILLNMPLQARRKHVELQDKHRFLDFFSAPLMMEYDYSEKLQLDYLKEVFEKIYKIVSITKCDVKDVINYIRSTIFSGIKFNIDYQYNPKNDQDRHYLLREMIENIGGIVTDKQNATHFIVGRNKLPDLNEDRRGRDWRILHTLNLKFLFHSYYFMTKVDEGDAEYTDLFESK